MTDQELRELERRFRETGTAADEANWIRGRLRVGELQRDRVRLASYLGHEAAGRLLDEKETAPSVAGDSYDAETCYFPLLAVWTRGLCRFGREPAVRAGLAASTATLPVFEGAYPGCQEPRAALELVEEWVLDQTPDRAERAVRAGLDSEEPVCMVEPHWGPPRDEELVGFGPAYCALTLADAETLLGHGSGQLSDFASAAVVSLNGAAHVTSSAEVLQIVATELVPWALGYRDAVAERVGARRASST